MSLFAKSNNQFQCLNAMKHPNTPLKDIEERCERALENVIRNPDNARAELEILQAAVKRPDASEKLLKDVLDGLLGTDGQRIKQGPNSNYYYESEILKAIGSHKNLPADELIRLNQQVELKPGGVNVQRAVSYLLIDLLDKSKKRAGDQSMLGVLRNKSGLNRLTDLKAMKFDWQR
jgi:hypothetical protein